MNKFLERLLCRPGFPSPKFLSCRNSATALPSTGGHKCCLEGFGNELHRKRVDLSREPTEGPRWQGAKNIEHGCGQDHFLQKCHFLNGTTKTLVGYGL